MLKYYKISWGLVLAALFLLSPAKSAHAFIDGLSGTAFHLTAKAGRISTPDGGNLPFWGFGNYSGAAAAMTPVQYPGPTLILRQGDTITVTLTNQLSEPTSIVFPGMTMLSSTAPVFSKGAKRNLTSIVPEAVPGGSVTYTFVAGKPGTFYYQSGSNQDIQLRMGLFGAIIVRPTQYKAAPIINQVPFNHYSSTNGIRDPRVRTTYNDPAGMGGVAYPPSSATDLSTAYDREYLFLVSEMDPNFQKWIEFGTPYDLSKRKANYFFINGRNAPDTMGMANSMVLPSQPYNCMPLMHPGERVLLRLINMGQDYHPFHTHGNHVRVIAEDGNLLQSPGGTGADLMWQAFTVTMAPGKTLDGIFTWTGAKLGWDIYDDTAWFRPYEYLPDHGKRFQPYVAPVSGTATPQLPPQGLPVVLPTIEETIAGPNWSGSPFMGSSAPLPPGEGGFNPLSGFFYMWHSHAERELTNFDIFPGGLMTMMGIIPWPQTGDNLDAFDNYMP